MNIIIFVLSYILLSIFVSLLYVGLILAGFRLIKKVFKMTESKWNSLFRARNGRGIYYVLIFPYIIVIAIMFPISMAWFEIIDFEYSLLASVSIILLLGITGVFKFSKLESFMR